MIKMKVKLPEGGFLPVHVRARDLRHFKKEQTAIIAAARQAAFRRSWFKRLLAKIFFRRPPMGTLKIRSAGAKT